MITPETVEKILDATRIEEVVGEFVSLKKRGVNLLGLCPFHNEKTPSFTVSSPKGIFKCFGCGKGGDAVRFLMEHEHYTYPEALKYLARKYNIDVEEEKPSPEQQQVIDEKESLFNVSTFAQKYFQSILFDTEEGKAIGLSYLKERGFTTETIKKFGLGYSLNQWDTFSKAALSNGYKKEYLQKTSLSKLKDHQLFDVFRGRVIFPIHNLSGRVLGFGARMLSNDKNKPKYINTAESDIYHKSKVLYGLYFAKSSISALDNCYLVEGYTDVISLSQAGIENVIASSGTALSTDQVKLIRRYTPNITLLFDSDQAGVKAAFRSIDMILEEGLNVRIVLFPEGEDPDSFAREKRPAEVRDYIEANAKDFISFKTQLLLKETQNDPIRKAALIKDIAATISNVPEPIARTLYIQKCSELMQIEEKLLVAEVNKLRRNKSIQQQRQSQPEHQPQSQHHSQPHPQPAYPDSDVLATHPGDAPVKADTQKLPPDSNHYQEREVIRLLLHYADKVIYFEVTNEDNQKVDVAIKVIDFIVQDIVDDKLDFENTACKVIFEIHEAAKNEQTVPDIKQFFSHPNESVKNMVVDLLSSPYSLSKNWEDMHQIYVQSEEEVLKLIVVEAVYSFKLKKLEKMIDQNRKEIKAAGEDMHAEPGVMIRLLEANQQLINIRNSFAKELNRIVTR